MSGFETPGAYDEARKRIREQKEREAIVIESKKEDFEKNKERVRSRKKLDVFELRRRIETGHSLDSLKSDIRIAFRDGNISAETYEKALSDIEKKEHQNEKLPYIDPNILPFSQNALVRFLEDQPLGNNIGTDMVGFLYGFFVQGSAILVILAWRILVDLLRLPVDIYSEIQN